jgi:hypothetical protein
MNEMRRLMTILNENAVPYDDYGYWIMPDGRIIPTAVMAHVDAAMEQLGIDPDEVGLDDDPEGEKNFNIRYDGLANGAVRVLTGRNELNIDFTEPTAAAMRALLRILPMYKGLPTYQLDDKQIASYALLVREVRQYIADMESE